MKVYKKSNSFSEFRSNEEQEIIEIKKKITNALLNFQKINENKINNKKKIIIDKIISEFKNQKNFELFPNVIEEIKKLKFDEDLVQYIINRYKYDVFPSIKELDEYPPNVQIEITSICNFRCVFCYQTDNQFNKKSAGFMGHMNFEVFKKIIDELEGNVQFLTLASRGEPLICKDFNKMIEYTKGKFLGLKINTNASMLTEDKAKSILESEVCTLVISADAAEEENYSKYRVNGNLNRIVKNLKKFNQIKNDFYPNSKIITRVSGVKFEKEQNYNKMKEFWGRMVDQVAFVNYLPWENAYDSKPNNLNTPCSDLWRRMFIWWDGSVNPCDVDYKSTLKISNVKDETIKEIWNSKKYNNLREKHLNNQRQKINICSKCSLI